jgi:hypothetical protein
MLVGLRLAGRPQPPLTLAQLRPQRPAPLSDPHLIDHALAIRDNNPAFLPQPTNLFVKT